jgi:hypothetical protein
VAHPQIKSFYFGDISEWSEFTGLAYPSFVITIGEPSFEKNITWLNFSAWASDRLTENNSNRNEVLSDMMQVMQDFIATVDNPELDWLPDVDGKNGVFYYDELGNDNADIIGGIKLDFRIGLHNPKNRCHIPSSSDGAQIGNFILTEEGLYIKTEDGEGIELEN